MVSRVAARRPGTAPDISPASFGWDSATSATLRHSTLPSFEQQEGASLQPLDAASLGARERLSLVAQFAAHVAFLQFAGIAADGRADAEHWRVIRRRGRDPRLVRIRFSAAAESIPPLTAIQRFANLIDAPTLDVLGQSWGRAEAVYAECRARIRNGAASDHTWIDHAATGAVLGGGAEWLRSMWSQRGCRLTCGPDALEAFRAIADLEGGALIVLQEQTLLRYGAIEPLRTLIGPLDGLSDTGIVDLVAAAAAKPHVIIAHSLKAAVDEPSRRVIEMLGSLPNVSWINIDPASEESRRFVLSTRLAARERLEGILIQWSRDDLSRFISSSRYDEYLASSVVPEVASADVHVGEPKRSYLAALALAGTQFPLDLAEEVAREFQFTHPVESLLVDGVSSIVSGDFTFASPGVRSRLAALHPPAARNALSCAIANIALRRGDRVRGALLLLEAGAVSDAIAELEKVDWTGRDDIIDTLGRLPLSAMSRSPLVSAAFAASLVGAGRYRAARQLAPRLDRERSELLLAAVDRRTGNYASSLAHLKHVSRSTAADLLRAELCIVHRSEEEAREILISARAETAEDAIRLGYMRSLVGLDDDGQWLESPTPSARYYAARLRTYRSLDQEEFEAAAASAAEAVSHAGSVAARIDAELDLVFALFTGGRWNDARAAAMRALSLVEETDGDRAAGGLLFLLAYLSADEGQWDQASHRIERLRQFYAACGDERHLVELDLLAAQVSFSRGEFEAARAKAAQLLRRQCDQPIREAAVLIVAETARLHGELPIFEEPVVNRELRDRARLLLGERPEGAFNLALSQWMRGESEKPPTPESGAERLKLFRCAIARGRQEQDETALHIAKEIAAELSLDISGATPVSASPPSVAQRELAVIHTLAASDYPFHRDTFAGARWRFAQRNRLGEWDQTGTEPPMAGEALETLEPDREQDWIICRGPQRLYVEGSAAWTPETRLTVGAMVGARAELYRLRRAVAQEPPPAVSAPAVAHGIIGGSSAMQRVLAVIDRVACRDVAVCIRGESGTGKERAARALHRASQRRSKPFITVNCAALPEHLVESELFGHVRGAFTGADRDRIGLVAAADGGTLFLDEVGEMPLGAQAKLLRFLQDGELRRIGDVASRSADVRVLTATNSPLEAAVEEGRFREDLYYRIKVVEIVMPPLRERHGDVRLLAASFLAEEAARHRSGAQRFAPEVLAVFDSYDWPGNVRELQNTVRAAHALAGEAREIDLEHLPERLRVAQGTRPARGSYHDAVARFRRDLIEKSLLQTQGNQSRAAELLRISRQALAYQIRELGIMVEPGPRL